MDELKKLENITSQQLTLFAEGSPAKTCPLPGKGRVCLESGQDCGLSLRELLMNLRQRGCSLKTSPVFYLLTEETTLESSFNGWRSGGMAWHGGCLTLNISDWPSDASVCSLSAVLETDVPPKYYLSPRACAGILRRAERRGKILPKELEIALHRLVGIIKG